MKKQRNLWPMALIILAISFITITAWSVYRANVGVSSVTDPSYYSHGLKYNSTSIETTAAETMGWTITPALTDSGIDFTLRDKEGKTITGCRGSITFSTLSANSDKIRTIALKDIGNGVYRITLPTDMPKSISASIILSKDQATIHRNLLINQPSTISRQASIQVES